MLLNWMGGNGQVFVECSVLVLPTAYSFFVE